MKRISIEKNLQKWLSIYKSKVDSADNLGQYQILQRASWEQSQLATGTGSGCSISFFLE